MKNAFRIYKRDIKKITTNWVALVVVIGLIILPSLYAWFNIKSSWDPYGSTRGIKVAVVNEDYGSEVNGEKINVGDNLVEELSKNTNIGWQFVGSEEALSGVKKGEYFASITIPNNFSKDIASLTTKNLQNPKLIYTVNESANAIAPKITEKGVQSVKQQIDDTIVETVNGAIFKVLNNIGSEYISSRDKIREMVDSLYKLNDKSDEIYKVINEAYDGTITIKEMLDKVNKILPKVDKALDDGNKVLNDGKSFLEKSKGLLDKINPIIKEDISYANTILNSSNQLLQGAIDNYDRDSLIKILGTISNKVNTANGMITNVNNILKSINNAAHSNVLSNTIEKFNKLQDNLNSVSSDVNRYIGMLNSNEVLQEDNLRKLSDKLKNASNITSGILGNYDSKIVPEVQKAFDKVNNLANEGIDIINSTKNTMPDVKNVLSLLGKGTDLGNNELKKLKEKYPSYKKSLADLTNKIRKLDNKEDINKILDIITNDWREESNFLKSPVKIEENRIFPIPNYGSAMSPFYSTLALWVGGLILVSILTTKAKPFEDGTNPSHLSVFFGKYLTFITIGILQGAVVTLGDILLLKTYVLHPVLFVIWGMFSSFIFITIIYSVVSVFDNVGKAICIIFLVLQVAASGGTFPVQLMSNFFVRINPFLPFRYAIEGMRGIVGGIVQELIIKDIIILIIFAVAFMILGVLLKKFVNKRSEKFIKKLQDSDIVAH